MHRRIHRIPVRLFRILVDINRNPQPHFPPARMPGRLPRRPVLRHRPGQFVQRKDPRRVHNQRVAHGPNDGETLRRSHAYGNGRVRLLVRTRRHRQIRAGVMLPVKGECFLRPRCDHNFEELVKAAAAFLKGNIKPFVDIGKSAAPHAQLNAPVADVVQRRHFLGHPDGMTQGQTIDGGADTHHAGFGGDGRGNGNRRGQRPFHIEVILRQPHGRNPQILRLLHQPEGLREGVVMVAVHGTGKLQKQSELHTCPPLCVVRFA